MRILLINPPQDLEALLGVGKAFVQKYEPLGLLYIAAVVRQAGYQVSVVDAYAEELSFEQIQERIVEFKPDIVGISTLTCNGEIVYKLGEWMKKNFPEILVVLGNVHASIYAKYYLDNNYCDVVVHGEGEEIFLKIVKCREEKKDFSRIPSISFLNEQGQEIKTGEQAVVDDLTQLPVPARDLVKQDLYHLTEISNQLYVGKKGAIAKTMFTSRGCPNRCTFCVVHGGKKQRFNSAERVVDELEMLEKEYRASYVFIMDSLFFGDVARLFKICQGIRERNLKIKWGADAHVRYINKELVEEIAAANCYELSFGIESGVQRLLNNIKKGTTLEKIEQAIALVKRYSKIKIGGLFILGLPGETYQDSLQTIRFAKKLPLDIAQFSLLMPYPGSPLFKELSAKGEINTGIRPDGTLDASIWTRYSSYISFTENDPIWVTPALSAKELKGLQKRAQREFYLRPSQIMKHIKRIRFNNIFKIIKIVRKAFFNI